MDGHKYLCKSMTLQKPPFEKLQYLSSPREYECVGGMCFLMLTSESLLAQPLEGEHRMLLLRAKLSGSMSSKAHFQTPPPPATPARVNTKTAGFQPLRHILVVKRQPTDHSAAFLLARFSGWVSVSGSAPEP